MIEEFRIEDSKAPFNMAISTLEAIRKILSHIEQIDLLNLDDATKQKLKINILKRFYVDSSPLLSDAIVEKYKHILELQPLQVPIIDKGRLTGQKKIIYSHEIEIIINTFLIQLQMELQREKYYMPPKKNLGSAVGSFG